MFQARLDAEAAALDTPAKTYDRLHQLQQASFGGCEVMGGFRAGNGSMLLLVGRESKVATVSRRADVTIPSRPAEPVEGAYEITDELHVEQYLLCYDAEPPKNKVAVYTVAPDFALTSTPVYGSLAFDRLSPQQHTQPALEFIYDTDTQCVGAMLRREDGAETFFSYYDRRGESASAVLGSAACYAA